MRSSLRLLSLVTDLNTAPQPHHSAELNDGETKVPATFSKSLADKFGSVKQNAVLKLTDVQYKENKAFVNEFEFVEDVDAEFVSDDAQASKKQKTSETTAAPPPPPAARKPCPSRV